MAATVYTVEASGDVAEDVKALVQQMGGIEHYVNRDERVLVKPACNSPYPFPATTDLRVIRAVVELLQPVTRNITVGDSSGLAHKPTTVAFDGMGLTALAREMDLPLVDFDQHEWVLRKDSRARLLKEVHLTSLLDGFDRLIFLPTMRTHTWARITMSLKLGMGLIPVPDRQQMHRSSLEQMIGELNLYFKPDLIILDGRKCFISGGPDRGEKREPGILLGGTGRVAIDSRGTSILKEYNAAQLEMAAAEVPMIRAASELGLP